MHSVQSHELTVYTVILNNI